MILILVPNVTFTAYFLQFVFRYVFVAMYFERLDYRDVDFTTWFRQCNFLHATFTMCFLNVNFTAWCWQSNLRYVNFTLLFQQLDYRISYNSWLATFGCSQFVIWLWWSWLATGFGWGLPMIGWAFGLWLSWESQHHSSASQPAECDDLSRGQQVVGMFSWIPQKTIVSLYIYIYS